jgi:hypothetical protein
MTNYEIVPFRIPANPREMEQLEKRLEDISTKGGHLVSVLPLTDSSMVGLIFTASGSKVARSVLEASSD